MGGVSELAATMGNDLLVKGVPERVVAPPSYSLMHPACPAVTARKLLPEPLQQVAGHCTLREKWERNLAQGAPPPPPLVESWVWGEPKGFK
jgi:hypothetical protein